jgi:hypothetical protein
MAAWQSRQADRFFITLIGVPGGVFISANAMANLALWYFSDSNFRSSST